MSALAHWLEDEGVATTVVGLVRPHLERIGPPRALWVPFELGRPLGPPNDPAFQARVVRAALALLERDDGPVVLEDFPDEAPDEVGDPGWRSPIAAGAADLAGELARVLPHWDRARAAAGRTTVGLSGLDPAAAAAWIAALVAGAPPEPPRRRLSPAQLMRFAADDLKACWLEAAASGSGRPSAAQLNGWLWDETVLGRTLLELRARCLQGGDRHFQALARGGLVPYPWRVD